MVKSARIRGNFWALIESGKSGFKGFLYLHSGNSSKLVARTFSRDVAELISLLDLFAEQMSIDLKGRC